MSWVLCTTLTRTEAVHATTLNNMLVYNQLHVRKDSLFKANIGHAQGGMRLAFPAYRENTQMSEDGFAGRLPWEVVAAVSWGCGFLGDNLGAGFGLWNLEFYDLKCCDLKVATAVCVTPLWEYANGLKHSVYSLLPNNPGRQVLGPFGHWTALGGKMPGYL
eukprot:537553-Pelagomonas_calceolata.AAC.3